MTREIKFRGKKINTGEWLIGDLVQTNFDQDGSIKICHIYPPNAWNGPDCYEVNPETVGQYTGLKDKNGREVYEGDLLKAGNIVYVCEWAHGKFVTGVGAKSWPIGNVDQMELLGNIHDNPEQLKGK